MRVAFVLSLLSCLLSICSAFFSVPTLLLRRSVDHVRLKGSTVHPDIESFILNDSIPIDMRRAVLAMMIDSSAVKEATAEKIRAVQMAMAEKISAVKETLHTVEKALWIEQERGRETMRLLETAMMRDATVNPRAVIDYVELFEMPQNAIYVKNKDRRKKWESFLEDDTTSGPVIMQCLKEHVPSWSGASMAADQISFIYSYTSEGLYDISPERWPLLLQGAKAMLCIGEVLGLEIELKKKG